MKSTEEVNDFHTRNFRDWLLRLLNHPNPSIRSAADWALEYAGLRTLRPQLPVYHDREAYVWRLVDRIDCLLEQNLREFDLKKGELKMKPKEIRPEKAWVGSRLVKATYRRDTPAGRRNRAEHCTALRLQRRLHGRLKIINIRHLQYLPLTAAARTDD